MHNQDELTYWNYLHVPELLQLQHPLSEPQQPDELQFIIIHQSFELWFKLMLYEMERSIAAIEFDDVALATHVMKRITTIQVLLANHMTILETMTPHDFHAFRGYLGTASGLQSYQFREVEILSGLRDDEHVALIKRNYKGDIWKLIERRFGQTSLAEAWNALLARHGIDDLLTLYRDPTAQPAIYQLAEELYRYDELTLRWRFLHIQLIERVIGGGAVGTGGATLDDIRATLKIYLFPDLWEVRTRLTAYHNKLAEAD